MTMHQDNMPPLQDPAFLELMALFQEKNYFQRLKGMVHGLRQPKETGDYKLARTELQRQAAPLAAILVPTIAVGMLMLLAKGSMEQTRFAEMEILETEEIKELEKIEEPERPIDEVQPNDIQFTPDIAVNTPTPDNAMSPQPSTFDAVLQVKSPVILRGIFGSTRGAGMRGSLLGKGGGNASTEAAVLRALRWLKSKQQADGSWASHKPAMTGMAILCYLAHGDKPGESREFGETVRKGIEHLIKTQPADGRWPGNYEHPIATYALCEAYGMTMNPNVKDAADRGVDVIIKDQHASGGWNYFSQKDEKRDDTSVMGWAAQALKAAKMAHCYRDPAALDAACKLAVKGFQKNYHANGGFGYTSPAQSGLSGVGTLCMQFHGAASRPEVAKTLEFMDGWKVSWAAPVVPGASPQYYFYYATQAMFQSGGSRWKSWNETMWPEYTKAQKVLAKADSKYVDADGAPQEIGWWENNDQHSDRPVMDTCLAALQLMVYYRYLPTFKEVPLEAEVAATPVDSNDIKVETNL